MNRSRMVNSVLAQRHQRGVVLVVALIMLLLLTIIGVAGIRDTQLQEKMAGAAQDRELALQAAEAALREAESQLVLGVCAGACAASGYTEYTASNLPSINNVTNVPNIRLNRSINLKTGQDCVALGTLCQTEADYWQNYPWTTVPGSSTPATPIASNKSVARYVIEKLPPGYSTLPATTNYYQATGTVPPLGSNPKTVTDFIITARGTGSTDDAVVILQSRYRYVSP